MQGADDIAKLREEEEMLLTEIRSSADEWRRYAAAKWLLRQACETFERNQQPNVIRDAGAIFNKITNGKYSKVLAPLGEDTIAVVTSTGKRKRPDELSHGTSEQLYLSLHLFYFLFYVGVFLTIYFKLMFYIICLVL